MESVKPAPRRRGRRPATAPPAEAAAAPAPLTPESLEQRATAHALALIAAAEWVATNLDNPVATKDQAPDAQAWTLYCEALDNRRWFFETIYERARKLLADLQKQQRAAGKGKGKDDGGAGAAVTGGPQTREARKTIDELLGSIRTRAEEAVA